MALSLASTSAIAFNPVQWIAKVGIVGFDQRAFKASLAERKASLSELNPISRVADRIVMQVPDVPNAPAAKVVGDLGFDPLSIGKPENFAYMREAEIKHGRLAMLAAVAWPLQEIVNPIAVDALRSNGINAADVLLESGGASPSLLNGGLFQAEVLPAVLAFFAGCAALEQPDLENRKAQGLAWNEYPKSFSGNFGRLPGNFGFDPLNLYRPLSSADKIGVQERELANGRVAMVAIATYVATEFFGQTTIVQATPALFEPIIFNSGFRAFMDSSFGMASMDGSIEGVAF